jgi:hypothetical protein
MVSLLTSGDETIKEYQALYVLLSLYGSFYKLSWHKVVLVD